MGRYGLAPSWWQGMEAAAAGEEAPQDRAKRIAAVAATMMAQSTTGDYMSDQHGPDQMPFGD
jgi:hypothetical protein